MKIAKRLLFFLPLAAGVILLITMVNSKKGPSRPEGEERSKSVKVVHLEPMTIIPRVSGFGYVRPTETWEAIPEVSGRVVEIHPELKQGTFVAKGELLVRIDPETYGLAESRSEAMLMNVDAQLKELEQQKVNTERLLEIEKRALQLTTQELKRKRDLFAKGYLSASDLELEEKNLLSQQASVNSLENSLELIPAQKTALLAQKESDQTSLSERRLDIAKTRITAPFDCRISKVDIELDQFAPAGSSLLTAMNISAVEIPVQLSPDQFSNLLSTTIGQPRISIEAANLEMAAIREMIGISAQVKLPQFSREAVWPATFMRTGESIDIKTGAVTAYVTVDNPYREIRPSVRPPLLPNMYVEVELFGRPRENRIVIPIKAIHGTGVYLVDQESRLKKEEITIEMTMGDFAMINSALPAGSPLVTTDLIPAIEGMLLSPEIDEELAKAISEFRVN